MNPKRMIIAGTMAFAIALSMLSDESNAVSIEAGPKSGVQPSCSEKAAAQNDSFLQALAAHTDEDVYDALYNGQSLAQIAGNNEADVQSVIDLQVSQMADILNERLQNGSITPSQFQAQLAELPDIISKSVYG